MDKLTNIVAFFEGAVAGGKLKWPKLRLVTASGKPVVISRNGDKSRNPGHFSVTNGGRYATPGSAFYGRITPEGEYFQSYNAQGNIVIEVNDLLTTLNGDVIGVTSQIGKRTGNCCFCDTPLTDEMSLAHGYGPVCAKKWSLPYTKTQMKASNKAQVAPEGDRHMTYLIILRDGSKRNLDILSFNQWVTSNNERIGRDFGARLDQFRRYSGLDIIDWTMEESEEEGGIFDEPYISRE
jgi:hypothetical protein